MRLHMEVVAYLRVNVPPLGELAKQFPRDLSWRSQRGMAGIVEWFPRWWSVT